MLIRYQVLCVPNCDSNSHSNSHSSTSACEYAYVSTGCYTHICPGTDPYSDAGPNSNSNSDPYSHPDTNTNTDC